MPDSKYSNKGKIINTQYCHDHFHFEDSTSNNVSVLCSLPPSYKLVKTTCAKSKNCNANSTHQMTQHRSIITVLAPKIFYNLHKFLKWWRRVVCTCKTSILSMLPGNAINRGLSQVKVIGLLPQSSTPQQHPAFEQTQMLADHLHRNPSMWANTHYYNTHRVAYICENLKEMKGHNFHLSKLWCMLT